MWDYTSGKISCRPSCLKFVRDGPTSGFLAKSLGIWLSTYFEVFFYCGFVVGLGSIWGSKFTDQKVYKILKNLLHMTSWAFSSQYFLILSISCFTTGKSLESCPSYCPFGLRKWLGPVVFKFFSKMQKKYKWWSDPVVWLGRIVQILMRHPVSSNILLKYVLIRTYTYTRMSKYIET